MYTLKTNKFTKVGRFEEKNNVPAKKKLIANLIFVFSDPKKHYNERDYDCNSTIRCLPYLFPR